MSKIKNGGVNQYGKVKTLTGSAVTGLSLLLQVHEDFLCQ